MVEFVIVPLLIIDTVEFVVVVALACRFMIDEVLKRGHAETADMRIVNFIIAITFYLGTAYAFVYN